MDRSQSHAIFSRAKQLMPGGVNSPARAFVAVGGEPIVMRRGAGAYLFDVDGNRYIDYVGSWGPMIFGHAHPRVVAAITEVATRGTSFGTPTEGENELAELIIDAVASVDAQRTTFDCGVKGARVAVTFSMGLAIVSKDDTPESLLKKADGALYQSKHRGRNQLNWHTDEPSNDVVRASTRVRSNSCSCSCNS